MYLMMRTGSDNWGCPVLSYLTRDIVAGMTWGEVELEPEVRDWLEGLDDQRWAQAMFHLDLLEERGVLLGKPYARQLSGNLRELVLLTRRAAARVVPCLPARTAG
jgi:hypothetical protein